METISTWYLTSLRLLYQEMVVPATAVLSIRRILEDLENSSDQQISLRPDPSLIVEQALYSQSSRNTSASHTSKDVSCNERRCTQETDKKSSSATPIPKFPLLLRTVLRTLLSHPGRSHKLSRHKDTIIVIPGSTSGGFRLPSPACRKFDKAATPVTFFPS